jgi:hypothetical protein
MTKHVRRRKAIAAVTAAGAVLALGLSFTSAAGAAPTDAAAATAVPGNLKLIKTKTSLLGKHYWYQQTFKGLPVVNGYYAKHVDKAGKVTQIADGRDAVPADLDVSAKVPSATATKNANTLLARTSPRPRRRPTALPSWPCSAGRTPSWSGTSPRVPPRASAVRSSTPGPARSSSRR